jgi:hypothetical protein
VQSLPNATSIGPLPGSPVRLAATRLDGY